MIERTVLIQNKTGIHARPAAQFVKLADTFQSNIQISSGNQFVNAKSIMKVLALGAVKGTTVMLRFDGEDEVEASEKVVALLESFEE